MAGSASKPGEMIQGINVTPLVDVVLVLLIVLMVSASYTVSKALPMELPKAATGESESSPLAISVDASGKLFLDGAPHTMESLKSAVLKEKASLEGQGKKPSALIAADGSTAHRSVVGVIDLLRGCGVTKFAINVAPEDLAQ